MLRFLRSNPWVVIALLSVVSLLNYFDRQSLSVVAPQVQAALHLSDTGYAHVVSIFLFASAITFVFAGFVSDAMGTRRSMALFVTLWSLAEVATAFVTSGVQLGAARFGLGLGEPGLWVAAPKAVGEVLEKKHRSLAVGIYTAGATVGAIIAVPLTIFIALRHGWPAVFILSGVAGLVWVPIWLAIYRNAPASEANEGSLGNGLAAFKALLVRKEMWQLMIARGMTDPVWFFYLFWFPKYLISARHISTAQLAQVGWIVYLFGGAGTILGGLLSGYYIRKGCAPGIAYRRSMSISAVLVVLSPIAATAPGIALSIAIASIMALAHMSWLINLTSVLLEVFPAGQLGKGAGMVAAGSAFGGMISTELVGYFVTHGGYKPAFLLMGVMHPLALALLWTAFRSSRASSQTEATA